MRLNIHTTNQIMDTGVGKRDKKSNQKEYTVTLLMKQLKIATKILQKLENIASYCSDLGEGGG